MKKFLIFSLVGGSGVLVNFAVLHVIVIAGVHPVAASLLSSCVAMMSNFVLNDRFTWRGSREKEKYRRAAQVVNYFRVSILGVVLTSFIFTILYALGVSPILCQLCGVLLVSVITYILNSKITWKGVPHHATL